MALGDVTIVAPGSIQGDDAKPFARAKSILNGFGVMSTTARDLIHADVKAGGYVVYNTTTSQLEYWNGSAWVAIGGGSGGGGGIGFPFTYSTTTTDSDPGNGTLRANHATLASATQLFIDIEEYGGTDVSDWLEQLDDMVGAIKGILRLQSKSDPDRWIEYYVTGAPTGSGYRKVPVAFKDQPAGFAGLTTTAGDTFLTFDAVGISSNLNNQALTNARTISYNGEVDNGNSGTADTIDWSAGALQKSTLTGNCTFTFTNLAAGTDYRLKLIQDGTGGRTVTWPTISWIGGAAPTLSTAPGAIDFVSFYYDGTTLFGSMGGGGALVAGNAAGQELLWDGTQWLRVGRKTGTALGDASVTVQYATAAQYIWPAATNTTDARVITLGVTGLGALPNAGVGAIQNFYLLRAGYAHNISFLNAGSGVGTKFTLPASHANPVAVSFYYDGTNWELAGWEDLGTVTPV